MAREALWSGRIEALLASKERMRTAELTNIKTHSANHNDQPTAAITTAFRRQREELVVRVEAASPTELEDRTTPTLG